MIIIPPPNSSFDIKPRVSIKGTSYSFTYRWNPRITTADGAPPGRWKLDIKDLDTEAQVNGITLTEDMDLTSHFLSVGFAWDGFLMVRPNKITSEPLGRNNFGPDKGYELLFIGYIEL